MAELIVLIPTRERPMNVARFLAAASETVAGVADIVFVMDDDDPLGEETVQIVANARGKQLNCYTRTQARMLTGPKMNVAARAYWSTFPAIMFCGDDAVPRTRWWDAELLKSISHLGGTGYAYPNGLGRTDIPEHVVISSDIVRALGWFSLPQLSHYYMDNAWGDLGFGAECITYRDDVVLEHMNPLYGKGPRDYVMKVVENHAQADHAAYGKWKSDGFATDLATVRSLLGG